MTILNLTGHAAGLARRLRHRGPRPHRQADQGRRAGAQQHVRRARLQKGLALGSVRVVAVPSETELRRTGATSSRSTRARCRPSSGWASRPASSARPRSRARPRPSRSPAARWPRPERRRHQPLGRISLTAGATVVRLTDFDIRLGGGRRSSSPRINGGSPKVAILDLDLSARPSTCPAARHVAGITAQLTQGAADALNAAFGTTALAAGLVLGAREPSQVAARTNRPLRPPAPRRAGGRSPFPLPLRSTKCGRSGRTRPPRRA